MEKIYNLPVDKIPLSKEEKDVFQWLYPKNEKETPSMNKNNQESSVVEKKITKSSSKQTLYYINLLCSFILLFIAIYPKLNHIWKIFIPTSEDGILFSVVKIFFVYFILYFINYSYYKIFKC